MISSSVAEICDLTPSSDSYHGRVRSSDQLQKPQEICDLAPSGDSYHGWVRSLDQLQHPQEIHDLALSGDRALGSPLGPHLESDLVTDLYSSSTPITNMDRSGCQISFNSLNKSIISLSPMIGALGSPLGPHSESDLETDLYSSSTLIAIKTSSIARSVLDNFKKSITSVQIYTLAQPSIPIWWDGFIRLQWSFQIIKHLVDLSLSWGCLTQ
jgi:hypothetical protein